MFSEWWCSPQPNLAAEEMHFGLFLHDSIIIASLGHLGFFIRWQFCFSSNQFTDGWGLKLPDLRKPQETKKSGAPLDSRGKRLPVGPTLQCPSPSTNQTGTREKVSKQPVATHLLEELTRPGMFCGKKCNPFPWGDSLLRQRWLFKHKVCFFLKKK